MSLEIIVTVVSGAFSVVFWFLRQKDEQQQAQIKQLFEKHDTDAQALQELRVQIASKHYERPELDAKINKLELAVKEGFIGMRADFGKLSDALIDHIRREDAR